MSFFVGQFIEDVGGTDVTQEDSTEGGDWV